MTTTGLVLVTGEVSTQATIDFGGLARQRVIDIGYDRPKMGFDGHSCAVLVGIDEQSPDIAGGVNRSYDARAGEEVDELELLGAGDQGIPCSVTEWVWFAGSPAHLTDAPPRSDLELVEFHRLRLRLACGRLPASTVPTPLVA